MDFKIDENLPVELATMLRGEGHDALTVRDQGLHGCPDKKVAAKYASKNSVFW